MAHRVAYCFAVYLICTSMRVALGDHVSGKGCSFVGEVGSTSCGVREPATEIETSAAFFETAGIRLVRGQSYGEVEPACASGGCSVVLSQEMARQLFGRRNPLGATLRTDSGAVMRVVGVASDVSNANGTPGPLPIIYEPWNPAPQRPGYIATCSLFGKAGRDFSGYRDGDASNRSRRSVGVENVQALIDRNTAIQQQLATIISTFAVLAVVLAMIVIHGVVSFSVRRQTKEIGVRIALGATSRDIYVAVARDCAWPIVAGIVGGTLVAVPTAGDANGNRARHCASGAARRNHQPADGVAGRVRRRMRAHAV